jgi:hypothetical protein
VAENASILALCASFLLWAALLWIGWAMIYCGSSRAVVDATTNISATVIDRVYFAGFNLTTLGIGDLKPEGAMWQIATVLTASSGFLVFTLFVTYSFSVISALNDRRTLGAAIGHLGRSPEEIVCLLANGEGQALSTRLLTLTDQRVRSAMQTDAYPVIEYSHVADPQRSFARGVVRLGEVALLLEHAIVKEQSLPEVVWKPLRQAVNLIIREKHGGGEQQQGDEIPSFELQWITNAGIAVSSEATNLLNTSATLDLRRKWFAWLQWHGRH